MARYRRHPSTITRKSAIKYNDNTNKHSSGIADAECVLEHRDLFGKDPPDTLPDTLDEVAQQDDLEYPFVLTDGNKRTWFFENASSAPVHFSGDTPGLSPSRRHFILADTFSAPNQDRLKDSVSDRDSPDHRELQTPQPGQRAKDTLKTRRHHSATHRSPTKRRKYASSSRRKKTTQKWQDDAKNNTIDEGESEGGEDDFVGVTFENQGVRIDEIRGTMEDILKKLQQKGLKQVLKAILKKCHTLKQGSHPYNGGKGQEQKRLRKDPDYDELNPGRLTAPDYWPNQDDWKPGQSHAPTGCRHREPDHIYKPERINLAMRLLHAGNSYQDAKFPLDQLRESTKTVTSDHPKEFQPDAQKLIEALYYAREKEIQYENGEIDGATIVHVPMPAGSLAKAKRKARNKKEITKTKQVTPETSGFFELGTPVNTSPSAHSSFTSAFNHTLKVESGSPPPIPSTTSSHTNVLIANSQISMKRLASQTSSYPSTSTSGELGAALSDKTTPAPSEGDTEADFQDEAVYSGGALKQAESQNFSLRTAFGLAAQSMSSADDIATTTVGDLPTSVAQAGPIPNFPHSLHDSENSHRGPCALSTIERPAVVPTYINPADTYIHSSNEHLGRPSYAANIPNCTYQLLTPGSASCFPLLSPGDNHAVAPPPTPMSGHNMTSNPFSTNFSSSANSDFGSPMLIDLGWHAAGHPNQSFQNYPYQSRFQQDQQQYQPHSSLPWTNVEGSSEIQQGDGRGDRRFWTGDLNAIAHEPVRFMAQQEGELVGRTPSTELGPAHH